MSIKTKTKLNAKDTLNQAAKHAGFLLMIAAATLGMLELPDHPDKRAIVPNQPALAFAGNNLDKVGQNNPIRREREETAPHYTSYSVIQRTVARAGKQ